MDAIASIEDSTPVTRYRLFLSISCVILSELTLRLLISKKL